MRKNSDRIVKSLGWVCGLTILGILKLVAQDYNSDGLGPDILLRNNSSGENKVWFMNGSNYVSEATIASSPDLDFKMIGNGNFDVTAFGQVDDILWQKWQADANYVWLMNGTSQQTAMQIPPTGDTNWRMVGTADFDRDGRADILWQNLVSVQNAVWLMNGPVNGVQQVKSYHLINSNGDPNWHLVGTGDFDTDPLNPSYGVPDIVLRNVSDGSVAIWFMKGANGLEFHEGQMVTMSGLNISIVDQDWRIVKTGDLDTPADGKRDILWRHMTLGIHQVWKMDKNSVIKKHFIQRQEYNADWRMASQQLTNSTWQLDVFKGSEAYFYIKATTQESPAQITLDYKLPISSYGITVERKTLGTGTWSVLANNHASLTYVDTQAQAGVRYEYKVYRQNAAGTPEGNAEFTVAGINALPIENKGKILLLVDQTLYSDSEFAGKLASFKQDLLGDGWSKVVERIGSAHVDSAWASNVSNLQANKQIVIDEYNADVNDRPKALILLGHITIPYAGHYPTDGHTCLNGPPDHSGAWPSDTFYADVDTLLWPDGTDGTQQTTDNCSYDLCDNVLGDGKFDTEHFPVGRDLKFPVGRIDFATLPVLGQSNVTLIKRYLDKNHSYRHKLLPWQTQSENLQNRIMTYGYFQGNLQGENWSVYRQAISTSLAFHGDASGKVFVGDFYLQRNQPCLFGFLAGPGSWDGINRGDVNYAAVEHSSGFLTTQEPTAAFYVVLASYLGDWYTGNDNYLRALLTTQNRGLASVWTRVGTWQMDSLALGGDLGEAMVRMFNNRRFGNWDRSRELTILGDCTLRAQIMAPPTSLDWSPSQGLVWIGNESGATYFVYQGISLNGPFGRISANPVAGNSFQCSAPSASNVYMVRALKKFTSQCGSYTNLSQGSFIGGQ